MKRHLDQGTGVDRLAAAELVIKVFSLSLVEMKQTVAVALDRALRTSRRIATQHRSFRAVLQN